MLKNRFPFKLIDRLREEVAYWKRQYEKEHVLRVKMIRAYRELEKKLSNPLSHFKGMTIILHRRRQSPYMSISADQAKRIVLPDDVRAN